MRSDLEEEGFPEEEADLDSPFFGYTNEQETGHPEVVSHLDALTRTDLKKREIRITRAMSSKGMGTSQKGRTWNSH